MKPDEPADNILADAIAAWREAQILRRSPAWNGRPLASHFVDILSERPELEVKLSDLLSDRHQLIVAYVLCTLDLMNSPILKRLPEYLLERREKVTVLTGSFSDKMELGAFARHLQKKHREKQN